MYTFNGENMKKKDINHEENFNKISELLGINLKDLKLKKLPIVEDYHKNYNNSVTYAAKNIKKILKALYPNTKFSVKTFFYANGNSINISWEQNEDFNILGPGKKEKEILSKAFRYGNLDNYEEEENLLQQYGQVKFLHYYPHDLSSDKIAVLQKEVLDKHLNTGNTIKSKNRL